jgi:putative hemolysin
MKKDHQSREAHEMKKYVDIEQLIKSKNPKLYDSLPRPIIYLLKRIIHERDVNYEINRNIDANGIEFSRMVLKKFNINVEYEGIENIPKEGRCIVVANHPIGSIDANALTSIIGSIRSDFHFMANDLLMSLPSMHDILIPLNLHGSKVDNLRIINHYFSSEVMILFFPAGLVSRKIGRIIKDLEWQKTFITQARKYETNILPVHIDGKLSNFFYSLYKFRKFIGIEKAVEMLFLVDEMYKQNNKTVRLTFGKEIPYSSFDSSHKDHEWAQTVKDHVYLLPQGKSLF